MSMSSFLVPSNRLCRIDTLLARRWLLTPERRFPRKWQPEITMSENWCRRVRRRLRRDRHAVAQRLPKGAVDDRDAPGALRSADRGTDHDEVQLIVVYREASRPGSRRGRGLV